jgi:hypothetical protein
MMILLCGFAVTFLVHLIPQAIRCAAKYSAVIPITAKETQGARRGCLGVKR